MRRRTFLAATVGAAVAVGGAGCAVLGDDSPGPPPALDDPPAGVYLPTSASGMRVVDTADAGDYRFGLLYSHPSRFWEVVGQERYRRSVAAADSVHLMTLVWDPETGVVLPDVGLTVEVLQDGELVVQEAVYAMLSQRLGFHYGDNFALPGDGEYTVRVRVGGLAIRRTGRFAGRFGESAAVDLGFAYRRADRDAIDHRRLDDPGTEEPLPLADAPRVPAALAPAIDGLPGRHLGRARVDDAVLDAVLLTGDTAGRLAVDDASGGDASDGDPSGADASDGDISNGDAADGDAYLAVLARTPHNGLVLPGMGLSGRVERDDTVVFDGTLSRTVDPVLGYHYGALVPGLASGDRLALSVLTPAQVARHEGYETAFLDVGTATMTVP